MRLSKALSWLFRDRRQLHITPHPQTLVALPVPPYPFRRSIPSDWTLTLVHVGALGNRVVLAFVRGCVLSRVVATFDLFGLAEVLLVLSLGKLELATGGGVEVGGVGGHVMVTDIAHRPRHSFTLLRPFEG
jgi:hypothetical protein